MRISTNMVVENTLRGVSSTYERFSETQQTLTTGKRITKASDDPPGAAQALSLQNTLDNIDQYQRNIDDAKTFMGVTDTALSQTADLARQARSLVVQGATDTISPDSRKAFAAQLDSILEQLGQVGNTTYGSRHIFGGQRTLQPPFVQANGIPTYQGGTDGNSDGALRVEVSPGYTMTMNVTGDAALSPAIAAIAAARDHLQDGSIVTLSAEDLDSIDKALAVVSTARSDLGSKVNRLTQTGVRLDQTKTSATTYLTKIADADIPQAVVDMKSAEMSYQAALTAASRSFQQSLVDFLK